jgi:hypothetical protein
MPGKGPKAEQLAKMIEKAQSVLDAAQTRIDSGTLTEEEAAEAAQTVADMTAKIERLSTPKTPPTV